MKKYLVFCFLFLSLYSFGSNFFSEINADSLSRKNYLFYLDYSPHISKRKSNQTNTIKDFGLINLGFGYKIKKNGYLGITLFYHKYSFEARKYDTLFYSKEHNTAGYLAPNYRLGYNKCNYCYNSGSSNDLKLGVFYNKNMWVFSNSRNLFTYQINAWLLFWYYSKNDILSSINNSVIDRVNTNQKLIFIYPSFDFYYTRLFSNKISFSSGLTIYPIITSPFILQNLSFRISYTLKR